MAEQHAHGVACHASEELRAFASRQLLLDERAIAAAVVRSRTHVEFRGHTADGHECHHEMVPVWMAWDDLPRIKRLIEEHRAVRRDGTCCGCGRRWPCALLTAALRRWQGRPGWRHEWLGEAR